MFLPTLIEQSRDFVHYFFDRSNRACAFFSFDPPTHWAVDLEDPVKRSAFLREFWPSLRFVEVNAVFAQYLGARPEQIERLRLGDILNRHTGLWHLASMLFEEGRVSGLWRCRRLDRNGSVWLRFTLVSLRSANGIPTDFFGLFREVTAETEYERAVEKQKNLVNFFFDEALDGFVVAKLEDNKAIVWPPLNSADREPRARYFFHHLRIVSANRAILKQYRAEWEEMVGTRIVDTILPTDFFEHIFDNFLKLLDEGQFAGESIRRTLDHRVIHVAAEVVLIRDDENHITGLMVTQRDITERKKLESQLQAAQAAAQSANQTKDEYLAHISHEVRNPLNSILGLTELLTSTDLTKDQSNALNVLRGSAEKLLMLINNLLDYSKMEAGKLVLEAVDFELKSVVDDALTQLVNHQVISKKSHVAIQKEIPAFLKGDATRLKQLLICFLIEASKTLPYPAFNMDIRLLTPSDAERFELKFEIKSWIKEKAEESPTSFVSGIERSLCHKLLGLMEGTMSGFDEIKGGPQTLSFVIPFSVGKEPDLSLPPLGNLGKKPEHSLSVQKPLLLIVEDDTLSQQVIQQVLAKAHYRTLMAANGEEAFLLYQSHHPDGILMDVEMPIWDGLTAARHIREHEIEHNYAPIPIIGMTGHIDPEQHLRCLGAGMNQVLVKPISSKSLYDVLEDMGLPSE